MRRAGILQAVRMNVEAARKEGRPTYELFEAFVGARALEDLHLANACCHGQGATAQSTCLIDRAQRSHLLHDVTAPAKMNLSEPELLRFQL